ncbi:hypothetical protein E2562_033648, partial [Oryza meyeriana var. granulata]
MCGHLFDYYCLLAPSHQIPFRTMLEDIDPLDTRAGSPLVDPEREQTTGLGAEAMQTDTPSGALSPALLGSCEETPICMGSDSSESDPKPDTDPEPETDPEEEDTSTPGDSAGSGPAFRITFAGGPSLRRTARKNTGSRFRQAKMEPLTTSPL